jgi:hypothetical protein
MKNVGKSRGTRQADTSPPYDTSGFETKFSSPTDLPLRPCTHSTFISQFPPSLVTKFRLWYSSIAIFCRNVVVIGDFAKNLQVMNSMGENLQIRKECKKQF